MLKIVNSHEEKNCINRFYVVLRKADLKTNFEKPLLCYDIGALFFFSRNKIGMKRVH